MGYTVELQSSELRCIDSDHAAAAADIVNENEDMAYHLQVAAKGSDLTVLDFTGDHWHDERACRLWLALAPHMRNGATLEFEGEGFERWRVRWQDGRVFEDYVARVVWSENREITAEGLDEEADAQAERIASMASRAVTP